MIKTYLWCIGCKRSEADSTLYVIIVEGTTVFILVYVDDIILMEKGMEVLRTVAQRISSRFEIRIESNLYKFLGVIIERCREKRELKIHALLVVFHLLQTFLMHQCRQISNPLPPSTELVRCNRSENHWDSWTIRTEYRQLFCSLLYLSNTTRPHISFAAEYLSIFLDYCDERHVQAGKRVLMDLAHTRPIGVVYFRSDKAGLQAYTDSDFATEKEDRKNLSRFLFTFSDGVVS